MTLIPTQPRMNQDERAAKLKSIQQSSKTSRTVVARKEILFYYIPGTVLRVLHGSPSGAPSARRSDETPGSIAN
ncbi:hypothetical protein EVAR_2722_1 [Eumeta japonica]|uniref:Uncharacterized protein n=1 Tax=Eumeta variegata TaxID=151549 RepID=A0A4C1SZF6_EUMVA|nr:hypothetical protein EVAR_2722_1 [Eumeta japonica]